MIVRSARGRWLKDSFLTSAMRPVLSAAGTRENRGNRFGQGPGHLTRTESRFGRFVVPPATTWSSTRPRMGRAKRPAQERHILPQAPHTVANVIPLGWTSDFSILETRNFPARNTFPSRCG